MQKLREKIRAILADDAIYRRKDLPGDLDDPPESGGCGCKKDCSCKEEYTTPKYALYQLIGDAIRIYDRMDAEETGSKDLDEEIMRFSKILKKTIR